MFIFERERERERKAWAGEGGRERYRGSEAGSLLTAEPNAELELTNHEIMTWAKVGRLTDWTTQVPPALVSLRPHGTSNPFSDAIMFLPAHTFVAVLPSAWLSPLHWSRSDHTSGCSLHASLSSTFCDHLQASRAPSLLSLPLALTIFYVTHFGILSFWPSYFSRVCSFFPHTFWGPWE